MEIGEQLGGKYSPKPHTFQGANRKTHSYSLWLYESKGDRIPLAIGVGGCLSLRYTEGGYGIIGAVYGRKGLYVCHIAILAASKTCFLA